MSFHQKFSDLARPLALRRDNLAAKGESFLTIFLLEIVDKACLYLV
jgi:hypothetical protein